MSAINDGLSKIKDVFESIPMINKALNTANEKTGAKKEHLAVIGVLLPVLLMISLGGAHFIIDLVAYLYPAYASVKAIETDDPEDDTMWLTYWLVFSLFKLVEGIADSLLHYIPFYAIAKCCFLIWCFHPSFKGSKIIYDSCIAPYKEFLFIDKKAKKQ